MHYCGHIVIVPKHGITEALKLAWH